MKSIFWLMKLFTCIVLFVGLPAIASAWVYDTINVSPDAISGGVIRVLPQASYTFSFTASVSPGPVPSPPVAPATTSDDDEADNKFNVSANVGWISFDKQEGQVGGGFTATITIDELMASGTYAGIIIVSSTLQTNNFDTIQVSMTVVRSIGDSMTVVPSAMDIVVTESTVSTATYPITISNTDPKVITDPNITNFTWNAVPNASWINLSQSSGIDTGSVTINFSINPQYLFLTQDTNSDGILDTATGTITIMSDLSPGSETITVNVTMIPSTQFSVSPSQLFWSVEQSTTGGALSFSPQSIFVSGGPGSEDSPQGGWSASYSSNFFSVAAFDATGSNTNGLTVPTSYGRLDVTPNADLLGSLNTGTYSGYISITDLNGLFTRTVPITINIRGEGELIDLPTPDIYQISPYYSMIEAAETSTLYFQLPVSQDFPYYSSQQDCENAGGTWIDPDSVSGNLNEYCSLSEKVYVLIELDDYSPGMVYAFRNTGKASLAYSNGVQISGSDDYAYADGPVPSVPFGPLQLTGLYGTITVGLKMGTNLASADELQRLQINVKTPDGTWLVTDTYEGEDYIHTDVLTLSRAGGQISYTGTWEGSTVTMVPGDGSSMLYQMTYSQNGFYYTYEIQNLTASKMSGRWRFAWSGGTSDWENFAGQRQWVLP